MANELINIELLRLNNDRVKAWVEDKIKEVGHLTTKKVEILPETDIDPLCIYFVPSKKAGTYDEYMYIDEKWELIGSSDADLSDYYRKSEADELVDTAIGEHNESELSHSDIRELIQYNADAIGDLSALKTTAKDSAVDAVNSVYDKQTKSITMSEDGVNMVFTKNDDTTVKFPLRSVIDETTLLGLADVDADGITGGQYLKYDAENRKFVPETVDNESQYKASKVYTDKKIEEAGMPAPEAKDRLLLSTENAETSELEWSQVDKSEVGEVPFIGTKEEWEALSESEQDKYSIVNITDDGATLQGTPVLITSHVQTGPGYSSGNIVVQKLGHFVQLDLHSVVTTGLEKDIYTGLPKPSNVAPYFVVQGDGNLPILGLGYLRADGTLWSGTSNAGMAAGVVWDGTIMYFTND